MLFGLSMKFPNLIFKSMLILIFSTALTPTAQGSPIVGVGAVACVGPQALCCAVGAIGMAGISYLVIHKEEVRLKFSSRRSQEDYVDIVLENSGLPEQELDGFDIIDLEDIDEGPIDALGNPLLDPSPELKSPSRKEIVERYKDRRKTIVLSDERELQSQQSHLRQLKALAEIKNSFDGFVSFYSLPTNLADCLELKKELQELSAEMGYKTVSFFLRRFPTLRLGQKVAMTTMVQFSIHREEIGCYHYRG